MKQLWTTLLAKVDTFIDKNPDHEGSQYVIREAKANKIDVGGYLYQLDVRRASALREHFREVFPAGMKLRPLHAWINDKGRWVISTEREGY
jgi:hypothetical protein